MNWEIRNNTSESDSEYSLVEVDRNIRFFFDYTTRVVSSRDTQHICFYSDGRSIGSMPVSYISSPLDRVNETLLETQKNITSDEYTRDNI